MVGMNKGLNIMTDEIIIPDDLRQRYLQRRLQDVAALSEAVKICNFDLFKQVGHQIKGNALTFGYKELEKIAENLEQAGDAKDKIQSLRTLEALKLWLDNVSQSSH
jgi:HPt (histidine-containing phosphotransfer) domain-containing protein